MNKGNSVFNYYNETENITIIVDLGLNGVDGNHHMYWNLSSQQNVTTDVNRYAGGGYIALLVIGSMGFAGLVLFLTGILGLVIKFKAIENKAIKLVKCMNSVWCIVVGFIVSIIQIVDFMYGIKGGKYSSIALNTSFIVGIFVKISFVSYKWNAVLVYMFQNVMIFKPFFFRRCRRTLTKILGISIMLQWILMYCILYSWAIVVVILNAENCSYYDLKAINWRQAVFLLSIVPCMLSFGLSSAYLFGFYRENASSNSEVTIDETEKERRAVLIRQTVLSCGLEVISNICLISYISATMTNCFKEALQVNSPFSNSIEKIAFFDGSGDTVNGEVGCNYRIALEGLERGSCAFYILMVSQPLLQELFLLVFRLKSSCCAH